jgi:uncharacterized protein (TIGR02687 family)
MEIIDKIQKLIQQKKRNIVFYFDDDGSFREELQAIEDFDITVIEVGQNYFKLKYLLEFELKDQRVFLYHPFPKPKDRALKEYPLLDLLIANIELRFDDASEFLSEYNLQPHHLPLVKRYIKYIKNKSTQRKLSRILDRTNLNEDSLKLGLVSVALDFHTVTNKNLCIAKWLSLATDNKPFGKANKTLNAQGLESELLNWINGLLNTKFKVLGRDTAVEVSCIMKYNILAAYIDRAHQLDSYSKLKFNGAVVLNRVLAFYNEWLQHPNLKKYIDTVFDKLANEIKSSKIIEWYGVNQEFGHYTPEILNSILNDLYEQILDNPLKARESCLKWLRSGEFNDDDRLQVSFLYHSSSVLVLLLSYSSFRFDNLENYIEIYANELFKIDLNYRKAVTAFDKVRDRLYEFEDTACGVFADLNQKYDRFLIELNVEWQKLLDEKSFNLKEISIDKQYDFYNKNLKGFEYKIVVIISDAFRYELGQELYNDLIADSKNTVSITPAIASIPSETSLGMANLLPHAGINVEQGTKDLIFRINGIATSSDKRNEILKKADAESNTVLYTQMMKWDRNQGRDFFRDNRLVYVYHDWVDAIGDKRRTEHETFKAASKAIDDLKRCIKKLYGWNVYHILVTSDHGFLFNYNQIPESSRENLPKPKGYSIDHVRFIVGEEFEGKVDGYQFNLKDSSSIETDLKVAVPRAINRFRKKGNIGLQFVHGGPSLQELVIPVIKLYRQKKEFGQSVTFKRIDDTKKITSGSLKVLLLQDQPVSNEYNNLEIILGLYSDTGELYSNEVPVKLNSTSENPQERMYEPILNLNTKGSKANYCYLKAFDKEDKSRLNPVVINDLIQISSLMEKDSWS